MNIDDMTIKQARELAVAEMFGGSAPAMHPLVGKKVLVVLPGRFIYMGTLEQHGSHYTLKDAENIRYWETRDNGLGELASDGVKEGDKIDKCPPIWFQVGEEIVFMEIMA